MLQKKTNLKNFTL
uniref:Uncharacterized protein n=1 Tax=Anguilla anguilla TaxID=7936 RepID=A0A0E9VIL3_ANGAN